MFAVPPNARLRRLPPLILLNVWTYLIPLEISTESLAIISLNSGRFSWNWGFKCLQPFGVFFHGYLYCNLTPTNSWELFLFIPRVYSDAFHINIIALFYCDTRAHYFRHFCWTGSWNDFLSSLCLFGLMCPSFAFTKPSPLVRNNSKNGD